MVGIAGRTVKPRRLAAKPYRAGFAMRRRCCAERGSRQRLSTAA
jgi:hypothetical protein